MALSAIAQLVSVVLLAIAIIALLLLCALRSSKKLHDDVSELTLSPAPSKGVTDFGFDEDVEFVDARSFIIL